MADMDDIDALFADFNALSTGAAPTSKVSGAASWDHARVIQHLESIGMPPNVIEKCKEHEVIGEDLVTLTTDELKADLGITRLQAAKIKRSLGQNMEAEEAAQEADAKAARVASMTGVLPPPADLSTADEPAVKESLKPVFAKAPAAAAAAAAAASSAPGVKVDAALVATWATKTALIAELEKAQVATKLPAAQQRLKYYRESFNSERQRLEELIEASDKAGLKFAKLEDGAWYPGKYLLGSKKREKKVVDAEKEVAEVSRKLEAARALAEDLGQKVQLQEREVATLSAQVQALGDAKRWEEQALQTAFTGNVGDPREYALETELASIVPQVEQLRRFKVSYAQAYELIRTARKQLDGANQAFQAAHGMARVDVMQNVFKPRPMRNSPLGVVADVAKHSRSRQGVQLADEAARNIIKAAQIIPDMPRVDLKKVKGLQGMMFMDVVFDNIITDMRAMRKIQEGMQAVQSMLRDITYVENWLRGWLDGKINQDMAAMEAAYAHKKAELDSCRRQLLQTLADNRKG